MFVLQSITACASTAMQSVFLNQFLIKNTLKKCFFLQILTFIFYINPL